VAYKTPGVYIVEKNAFPNSVVEVATAVPAFVGHTEKAINKGNTLRDKPWRVTSMSEYVEYFGGEPESRFTLTLSEKTPAANGKPEVAAVPGDFSIPAPGASPPRAEYLLRRAGTPYSLYACMQLFFQNGGGPCYIVSVGDYTEEIGGAKLTGGVNQLKKELEPTLVVIPEAVMLDLESDCISVQQAVLQHCGVDMKNRFAILDVHQGYLDRADVIDPVEQFRDHLGTNSLKFAAAYYPWLETTIVKESDLSYRNIDAASATLLGDLLHADMKIGDMPAEPIPRKSYQEKVDALGLMSDQWVIAKVTDGKYALLSSNDFMQAQVVKEKADYKGYDDMVTLLAAAPDADARAKLLSAEQLEQAKAMIEKGRLAVHQLLSKSSALYNTMLHTLAGKLNRLPPSAAIAGLYTSVDNARGVWKAPANVSLNSVVAPSVNISHEEQEDLNVTTGGKSINAIRSFIGAGVMVWGARTLDGNSLDWRYVNVRRTMIMLEESLRLAMAAYVFEPNTANTWVTVKGMANNFLTGIWKRGGLAGASADDAFSVQVGLGQTMTAEDILEGRMNVTILVALSRPAEFIELTFQQQMQKS
jgi:phage tail sheath protein FI